MLNRSDQKRRGGLRWLDDILETLEQLNLHDKTELPDPVAEALVLLGIDKPHSVPVPPPSERVWAMHQPYLIPTAAAPPPPPSPKVSPDSSLPSAPPSSALRP